MLFIQNYAHLLNIIANEPSLGMYRIQEHIRKTLPKLDQQCLKLNESNEKFKDLLYGVEQSTHAIKSIENAEDSLNNIEHTLVQLNNLLSQNS